MGFFLGNRSHKPARVSWNGTNVAIEEYTNLDLGAAETLYLRGASISPTVYDGTVAIEGEVKDEYLTSFDENYNYKGYKLVKIFDKVWLGEDYRSQANYLSETSAFYAKALLESNSLIIPVGWEIPTIDDYKEILTKLEANGISLLGSAFLKDGVLGFNAPLGGYCNSHPKVEWASARSGYWTADETNLFWIWSNGEYQFFRYWAKNDYYSLRLVKK